MPRAGAESLSPRRPQMFVHFSITTFTNSQSGFQDPALFAPPANMSVKNWVATAKAMGAPVVALTAKHEAGFCIWPSKYSNYTIASSPTVGHRDLVREFVDECRAQVR
jgi:alpha-L-fucosidase